MRYLGGKSRIAKELIAVLNTYRLPGQLFVEPFLGGCNVLPLMDNPRLGAEINPSLIMLYKALQAGYVPPTEISEADYAALKNSPDSPLKGFVGVTCSFSGKWFGGYARSGTRNYALNGKNTALKTAPLLNGAELVACSYEQLNIPNGSLVYCDPPYEGTTGYGGTFNHDAFWDWVRVLSKRCSVLVSGYKAPPDFEVVWEKQRNFEMGPGTRLEKLFKLKGT